MRIDRETLNELEAADKRYYAEKNEVQFSDIIRPV
jgi:hypothetical protein